MTTGSVAPTPKAPCCANCAHWAGKNWAESARCRRYPPTASAGVEAAWPRTQGREVCGEHPAVQGVGPMTATEVRLRAAKPRKAPRKA